MRRTAGFDVERFDADLAEPVANADRHELWSIVRSDVFGRAVLSEEVGQAMQHIVGSQPSGHDDRQAAACELIEHDEHPAQPIADERVVADYSEWHYLRDLSNTPT